MKFKKYKTYTDVVLDTENSLQLHSVFAILAKSINKEQALQIAKILYPTDVVTDAILIEEEELYE